MIPYGRHHIDPIDVAAVVDVLENQFLTQGQQVPRFENALTAYCQATHAVAVNSGTSALHIACLALGVGPGDIVWTSPISFVASANCARYCGADVDFVDIDPVTRNMSVAALEDKLKQAKISNKLPKVIIPVHYAGLSCNMQEIRAITQPLGIALIEDASHALGGHYENRPVGSCQYSDACVLSFHPVKSITTAEGGAVLTNNAELAKTLRLFSSHGITRDPGLMEEKSEGPWFYQQVALGYNYRLSDLHAALGISQLTKLDDFIKARAAIAQRYNDLLADLPLNLPVCSEGACSAWHLYSIELLEHERADIFVKLQQQGIGVNVHYIPIHLQPYYRQLRFRPGDFPHAEAFYQRAITLPLYPALDESQQLQVVNTLIGSLA
ncbi:UDP-4-amino-4,6-dideoxy-N-acetyl-beta-L-altrosamine transaminase [Bowmanella yangjiangensis]|uniref:UDP-4-amino-4, 6-dideoxy-N-acetyl-beta-L-altrosamine transaminase n=1 Tax=Bowmanella yangjiangensis TaxID=2811230 RepID=A0ABS3CP38_9ALTE|nr:UDP-4-amino-4,6-dideoxy-N-acetyl-beta-L-altrosamine transaminase [Bowmanella yangjiangensis]MBN7818856.1 UDP-4-amino-4,6-dideoxy-N-acetyl-beta-L-altrosamine transaminase [Bowmanella yangjiangensis]